MYTKQKRLKNKKSLAVIFVTTLVLVAAIYGLLSFFKFDDKSSTGSEENAKTTSTAPTAQEDFSNGNDRTPNQTDRNIGTASDNNGSIGTIPPESQWSTSADGAINLFSPSKNAIISNGQIISGKSSLRKINFRLIDDVSGVIIEGNLAVVNGQFSGTLNFNSEGNVGRLDLFYATTDGVESNNMEVPVRFR